MKMSKKIVVDKELCKGHDNGRCVQIAPEVFDTRGEYPKVVDTEELDDEKIQRLIKNCPSEAIKVIEE
ncbi:hypothetical protein C9439_00235 [archaeon SCG-AAA382B04]|nr:hypothetical protein C9439_00235 [archaeon SCG-AAA382B04]